MKTILKLAVVSLCAFFLSTAHAQYGKLWWNPDQNGMGTPIEQQTSVSVSGVRQEIIFGVWFHYTQAGEPTWLAFSCGLVKDSLGRDGCADVLFQAKGSPPLSYDPNRFQVTTVGTMQIVFNSNASATFTYDFTLFGQARQSGTLNWIPQIFAVDANVPGPLQVLPGTASVFPDVPVEFTVSGGSGGYTLTSNNTAVVPVPVLSAAKFTVLAKSVNVDTSVILTVRDSVGATVNVGLTVRPAPSPPASTLNNAVTITPITPTGTGCAGLCSGGDAEVAVTAIQNGIKLVNRPIRFDVFQGDFRFVTPGTNVLVTSIVLNTDENGVARARMTATVTAPTQVAILTTTDTVTGLVRRTNFVIAQVISGVGILSILPAGSVTFTGAQPTASLPAQCPLAGLVDHYIYGGTPPYSVVSPSPQFLAVTPSVVTTNGGRYRVTLNGCGTAKIIVTDAQNRAIESSAVVGVLGPTSDAPPVTPPTSLTITPSTLAVGCGQTGSVILSGSGTYTATVSTTVSTGALTVTPTAGSISGVISFTRNTSVPPAAPITSPTNISVNVVAGGITVPVTLTVPATCP